MKRYELQGSAERLESLLQTLEDSQFTGVLAVSRSKAGVSEQGDLTFIYGEIVDAHAGKQVKQDALQWLMTWGNCQYTAHAQSPDEVVISIDTVPVAPKVPNTPFTFIANLFTSGSSTSKDQIELNAELPTEKAPAFSPAQSTASPTFVPPIQPFPVAPPTPTGRPAPTESAYFYNQSSYEEQSYAPTYPRYTTPPQRDIPATPVPPRQEPPVPAAAHFPYRIVDTTLALALLNRLELSRLHRHVFLLLDGSHSENDLVRLTRRPLHEIKNLLAELTRIGLIRID